MRKLLVLILPLIFLSGNALAEVAIIVNAANADSISDKQIKKIFLGKSKTFPSGSKVIPIGLSSGSAISNEFNEKVLGKSSEKMKAYWSKKLFTGKGTPPKEYDTSAAIIDLVKQNPGVIGYIDAAEKTADVKVVKIF